MELKVNLFVHGTSKGHMVWGLEGTDDRYANGFYSVSWPLKEMMMVEVKKSGSTTYCYYSFIRGEKVLGADKRDGSYFAITLRMNACHTDLQDMYHILRTAYEKACVGMCIQECGAYAQFTTDDFHTVEDALGKLRANVFNHITQFYKKEDIIPLNGFQCSAGKAGLECNDSESKRSDVLAALKRSGKVLVSHLFPTLKEAEIQTQANQKIEKCKTEAQKRIQETQEQAKRSIEQLQKQCASEKKELQDKLTSERQNAGLKEQNILAECNKKIAEIQTKYAKFDQKEKQYKQQIGQKDNVIMAKNDAIQKKDNEITNLKKQVESANKQACEIQDNGSKEPEVGNRKWWKDFFSRCDKQAASIIGFLFLLNVITIALVSYNCYQQNEMQKTMLPAIINKSTDIVKFQKPYIPKVQDTPAPYTAEEIEALKGQYTFTIDVAEFVGQKKTLKTNEKGTLSLKIKGKQKKQVPDSIVQRARIQGQFEAGNGIQVNDTTLKPSRAGTFKVYYKIGNTTVTDRDITVTN